MSNSWMSAWLGKKVFLIKIAYFLVSVIFKTQSQPLLQIVQNV